MAKKEVVNEVPANQALRKPTAKKEFNLEDFRAFTKKNDMIFEPEKPLRWIKISDALEEVTGIPGFLSGYVCTFSGFSDTGKSTAMYLGIVNAQKAGDLPIIIDLETNLSKHRLSLMGFDWDGKYIMIDGNFLLEKFGKPLNKNKVLPTIEDMAACVKFFIKEQDAGRLGCNLVFAIDSIGALNCNQHNEAIEKGEKPSNLWNSGAYQREFGPILDTLIPQSRKVYSEYTNTIIAVQKVGRDPIFGTVAPKGGQVWNYTPRLKYYFGGEIGPGVKKITAISKGKEVSWGTKAKIKVLKNHLDSELGGLSMSSSIISVPHGFITDDGIEEYKKKNILYFRKLFKDEINPEDITNVESAEINIE